jgi:protein TonB
MRQMQRAGAIALATMLFAGCGAAPSPQADVTGGTPGTAASPSVAATGDVDALRERARQAMQASRVFAPAGDNALAHYLALREQLPGDARVGAALEDLQPQLVIAIEQAISRGEYTEGRRLLDLLVRTDAQAPALPRLRETVASAEAVARDRALAVDAEALAEAERTEAELRRVAQENATRLAGERGTAALRPPAVAVANNPPSMPSSAPAAAASPAVAEAPARIVAAPPARPVEAPRPPPAPVQQAAASPPKLLRDVAPRYPEGALRQRQSGQVQVAFTISPQGGVESPRVVASDLPTAFDRAALAAAARWKFEATGSTQPGSRTVRFDPPGG